MGGHKVEKLKMKRKREQKNDKIKRIKIKDDFIKYFEKQQHESDKILKELKKIDCDITKLKKAMVYIKSENDGFISKLSVLIEELYTHLTKELKGFHEAHFQIYKNHLNQSVIIKSKNEIKKLEMCKKNQKKRVEIIEKNICKMTKKHKFKQCQICTNYYKFFNRNCLCKSDQNMCLKCIQNWYETNIKECQKNGEENIFYSQVTCPFCKSTMGKLKCPFCKDYNKLCKWCKNYKELNATIENFIMNGI
jgi:hypothetical protein